MLVHIFKGHKGPNQKKLVLPRGGRSWVDKEKIKKKKRNLENTVGVVWVEVVFICFPPFSDITVLQNSERKKKPSFFFFINPFFFGKIIFFYYTALEFPVLPLPSPPFRSLFHSFFFSHSSKSNLSL